MVYITSENYEDAYNRILDGAAEAAKDGIGACTVLVFVANDPDALCASRILFIICLDDGDLDQLETVKDSFNYLEFGSSNSGDEDTNDEDTEYDSDFDSNSVDSSNPKKRSKLTGDQEIDAADAFIKSQNRKSKIRAKKDASRKEIASYYSQGSYYGQSSAICLFQVSENLGRPNITDIVWWAIVGVTSQILLDQIDAEGYSLIVNSIKGIVSQLSSFQDTENPPKKSHKKNIKNSSSSVINSDTSSLNTFNVSNKATDGTNSSTVANSKPNTSSDLNSSSSVVATASNQSILGAELEKNNSSESAIISASKNVQPRSGIFQSSEFKFYMVRHWSLENAMRYSSFIISRLATWSSRGKSMFDLMVAKLGLSRTEIRQNYINLDPMLKEELPERWDRIAADYNLEGANYPSFVRAFGWRFPLVCASDHVWSLIALLSASDSSTFNSNNESQNGFGGPTDVYIKANGQTSAYPSINGAKNDFSKSGNSNNQIYSDVSNSSQISNLLIDDANTSKFKDANDDSNIATEQEFFNGDRDWKSGFFNAYDSLSDTGTLLKGIELAKSMQTGIIDMGTLMLERRIVKTLSKFRLAVIGEDCLESFVQFLHSPLVLIQLGQFLLDALRNHGRSEHLSLPFILAALDPHSRNFLVLGIAPPEYYSKSVRMGDFAYSTTYSGEARNKFGLIFEQAAVDCSANILNSYFDASVVSISSKLLPGFIDKLRKHT
ncbi:Cell division control protein 45-like protein [Smittium mucronatum]|uniref:Cell division control protein 45-like protein n=1 Tax=Smittium mucronatum TaxID=133383 RepID=A0A1R0H8E6_9FUNG|nr:Cell division control protein 45-like protein [Smittium mucronatum]